MDSRTHLLLAHEMPGGTGQEARHGCEFEAMFANAAGSTPSELLQSGIYREIAVPLKDSEWRQVSMRMLTQALAATESVAEKEGDDEGDVLFDQPLAATVSGTTSTSTSILEDALVPDLSWLWGASPTAPVTSTTHPLSPEDAEPLPETSERRDSVTFASFIDTLRSFAAGTPIQSTPWLAPDTTASPRLASSGLGLDSEPFSRRIEAAGSPLASDHGSLRSPTRVRRAVNPHNLDRQIPEIPISISTHE